MRAFLIACAILLAVHTTGVSADPKQDAMQVVERWAQAFTASDVDAIVALYAPDALFLGTVDKAVANTPAEMRAYFERALLTYRPRSAQVNTSSVLVLSDTTVIVTGLDTVGRVRDGVPSSTRG